MPLPTHPSRNIFFNIICLSFGKAKEKPGSCGIAGPFLFEKAISEGWIKVVLVWMPVHDLVCMSYIRMSPFSFSPSAEYSEFFFDFFPGQATAFEKSSLES